MENRTQKSEDMSTNHDMLSGMFHDRESTENAYKTLVDKGYSKDEINLVMTGETLKKHFLGDIRHTEYGAYTTKYAVKDPSICSNPSVISEEIGLNGKSVVVRGLVIILSGPIASGISGSGASGIPGGIIGALIESGFSKTSSNIYEAGIKKGNIIIGVKLHNDDDAQYIKTNWRTVKVEEIHI